ncbi:Amidase domain-containing protein [Mycena kentingensis (nom. inval.)]|nr:Amidase domain-containing protein [Mycena kentingensis (nom. inval.)]
MSDASVVWPQAALTAVAELNAKIPADLRLPAEFIARYPPGSDVRGAPSASGLLSPDELEITSLDGDSVSLLDKIKRKDVTAVQVASAFCKRAAIAQQLLFCLTDFMMEDALKRAAELDAWYESTGELVGPLHGTTSRRYEGDNMMVKGTKSGGGFLSDFAHPEAMQHGLTAQILYDAGAVFFAKTNLPQSIMHLETYSFWGQALNPINTGLTPGGSSGGSSALIAFGGSTMGMGSDIGGSLRSPANACGIWTLKPTCLRLPKGAGNIPMPGADSILATWGPLCRSLRDLELMFSVILGTSPWLKSPDLVPILWSIPTNPTWSGSGNRLKVGVMWHDGVVLPQPPIRRALNALVEALKQNESIEVVDYVPFKHREASELAHQLYFIDGGARIRAKAAETGEPVLPLTEWVLTHSSVKEHTAHDIWELHDKRDALRAEYVKHFNTHNVDVVLCPAGAGPAPALGTCKYWGYTNVWNFLDYPAAVFPTGLAVDPTIDVKDSARQFMSAADEYNAACYEFETLRGAPLCLQLVSRRYTEELLICALRKISTMLPLK